MTEIKLTMADPARGRADLLAAAEACGHSSVASHLREMAAQIELQVKPAIEEPTGDVVVLDAMAAAWIYDGEARKWLNDSPVGSARTWPELLAEFADAPKIYRNEVELTELAAEMRPQLAEWESDLLNEQARRDTAAAVLAAMDVDRYLIDAVVNARPR